ncbi:hypothetical protein ACOSQ3_021803 [Xanthoceras sorbifolium]
MSKYPRARLQRQLIFFLKSFGRRDLWSNFTAFIAITHRGALVALVVAMLTARIFFFHRELVHNKNQRSFRTSMHRHLRTLSYSIHSWPQILCRCCLQFSMLPLEIIGEKMDPESLYEAGNFILSFQSENGGLAVWERAGASLPLEWLNPVEFLDDLVAFVLFKKLYPNHKKKEVENFITEAVKYIEEEQTADGSWYGNWGICFLYGTAFALGGLAAAGKTYNNCLAIRRAVEFMLNSQSDDDGWGESFLSCPNKIYTPLEGKRSNSVQTALAEITGVFLRNCVLHYPDCRNIFPLWALAECLSRVPLPSYIAYNNSNREYIE